MKLKFLNGFVYSKYLKEALEKNSFLFNVADNGNKNKKPIRLHCNLADHLQSENIFKADLYIKDNKIFAFILDKNYYANKKEASINFQGIFFCSDEKQTINKIITDFAQAETIDAQQSLLLPGIIDMQVNLGDLNSSSRMQKELQAAAKGGVSYILAAPDHSSVIDNEAVAELITRRARQIRKVFVLPIGALSKKLKGKKLAPISSLKNAGCRMFSTGKQSCSDLFRLKNALLYAKGHSVTVMLKAFEKKLANKGVVASGKMSSLTGLPGIYEEAEVVALAQLLLLIESTGIKAHISQITSAKSVEMIARAKQNGLSVSCDVSINNLHFTELDVLDFDVNSKLDPPLRTIEDKSALISGLKNGVIDAVVSDHISISEDEKNLPFAESKHGSVGLETLLNAMYNLVIKNAINLDTMLNALVYNPAKIADISNVDIELNSFANFSVFALDETWIVNNKSLLSSGKNSIFESWLLEGVVKQTIHNGKIVYKVKNKE